LENSKAAQVARDIAEIMGVQQAEEDAAALLDLQLELDRESDFMLLSGCASRRGGDARSVTRVGAPLAWLDGLGELCVGGPHALVHADQRVVVGEGAGGVVEVPAGGLGQAGALAGPCREETDAVLIAAPSLDRLRGCRVAPPGRAKAVLPESYGADRLRGVTRTTGGGA
jgi:hypothetical protein